MAPVSHRHPPEIPFPECQGCWCQQFSPVWSRVHSVDIAWLIAVQFFAIDMSRPRHPAPHPDTLLWLSYISFTEEENEVANTKLDWLAHLCPWRRLRCRSRLLPNSPLQNVRMKWYFFETWKKRFWTKGGKKERKKSEDHRPDKTLRRFIAPEVTPRGMGIKTKGFGKLCEEKCPRLTSGMPIFPQTRSHWELLLLSPELKVVLWLRWPLFFQQPIPSGTDSPTVPPSVRTGFARTPHPTVSDPYSVCHTAMPRRALACCQS